jgi:hypothetical protein
MTWSQPMFEGAEYRLSIHADPLADGLARILNAVALQPVTLISVRYDRLGQGSTTVLKIAAIAPGKADLLAQRLGQAAWVRDVQLLEMTGPAPLSGREPPLAGVGSPTRTPTGK